jgi:formylglycine-generating enzyme required for sulfatase activity
MIDNRDGTVTDKSTDLMWQQETIPNNTMSWRQALSYCEKLNLGGHTDWRLPTIKELQSLVDYSRYNPAIDTTYFPTAVSSLYWSSTTYASNTLLAWGVYFYNGHDYTNYENGNLYVRAVRGVQKG